MTVGVGRGASVAMLIGGMLLTIVIYLPALGGGFVFDDLPNIVEPPGVHWTEVSGENLRSLRTQTMLPRRVVANLSFAVDHLFGGLDPFGYHLTSLLIHLAVGCALFWVIVIYRRVTASGESDGWAKVAGAISVMLFLVSPLNTQTVSYVVQRMTSLATLFGLLAFGAYVMGRDVQRGPRRIVWFVGAGIAWLAAIGSKENAAGLVLVVAAYEFAFHREAWWWRSGQTGLLRRRALLVGGALTLCVVAFLGARWYVGGNPLSLTRVFGGRDYNGLERLLTQGRVQLFYLSLLLAPFPGRLNLDHDFAVSRSLVEPVSTLPSIIFWLFLVPALVYLTMRRPRYGFPLLAYIGLHTIEAAPINLELLFEHRMYFPMAMLAVGGAAALTGLRHRREICAAGLSALVLIWAGMTLVRNQVWSDPLLVYEDVVEKSPNKFRGHYNLGTVLGQAGRIAEAEPSLLRALEIDPSHADAHNQLGNAMLMLGRPDSAAAEYGRALAIDSNHVEAVFNRGLLYDRAGRFEEAARYYRRFVEIAPPMLAEQVRRVRGRLDVILSPPR